MSDSYFIGTVSRVHNLWRFARPNLSLTKKSPLRRIAEMEATEIREGARGITEGKPESSVGMMVSLDHTIYFHRPREIRADQWLCTEMESPWAGEGRGLVFQRIWNREGQLIASCVQEVSLLLFVGLKCRLSFLYFILAFFHLSKISLQYLVDLPESRLGCSFSCLALPVAKSFIHMYRHPIIHMNYIS